MVKLLSTNCQCSKCIKKYDCPFYKVIVLAQRNAKQLCEPICPKNMRLRFQTELCNEREIEDIKK